LNIHIENAHGYDNYAELKSEDALTILRDELIHFGEEEHLPLEIRSRRSSRDAMMADVLVWMAAQKLPDSVETVEEAVKEALKQAQSA